MDTNLIKGCQSKVWLHSDFEGDKVIFTADSDAILTKGLVALLLRVYNDQHPKEILKAIHEDGTVFISSTNVSGKYALRIAVLSFRTHQYHIDFLINLLKEKIADMKSEGKF